MSSFVTVLIETSHSRLVALKATALNQHPDYLDALRKW